LRWRDAPVDYARSYSVQAVFQPAGYCEGMTARLLTRDGRYAGAFHVSTDEPAHPSDAARDAAEWLAPALASVCDVLRAPLSLAGALDPAAHAALVDAAGQVAALPGRDPGPWLVPGTGLVEVVRGLLRAPGATGASCWRARTGDWHRVQVARTAEDGGAVVCERAAELPHELTAREIDVLTLLAAGAPNRAIAASLVVAPRTVATHVEHIFDKLGCRTRTACAVRAVSEGWVREPPPRAPGS
jgi:DNA-binding CsgD family transcriptional regulator